MNILISKGLEQNLERVNYAANPAEIDQKKRDFIEKYRPAILICLEKMLLKDVLKGVVLGLKQPSEGCLIFSEEQNILAVNFNSIDDERENNYLLMHQLAHIQDVKVWNFDLKGFSQIAGINLKTAYLVWDVFLDSRLARESYLSYFQARGLFYDYKIKFSEYAKNYEAPLDDYFEHLWNQPSYNFNDVKEAFNRLNG